MLSHRLLLSSLALSLSTLAGARLASYPIAFDSSLLPSERRLVLGDIQLCDRLSKNSFDLGVDGYRSATFVSIQRDPKAWLLKRIHAMVGPIRSAYYPSSSTNSITRNLGALLSAEGRTNSYYVSSLGYLKITGPEVGLLQFTELPSEIRLNPTQPAYALVNRLFRLGLLFHDARHSEGSGDERGLPHHTCPPEMRSLYQNQCDIFIDASLGVEVFVGNALVQNFARDLKENDRKLLIKWLFSRRKNIIGLQVYGQ